MKKNILYMMITIILLLCGACSDLPEDASEKHVYKPNENVYLRADAKANIPLKLEFRKGKITPKVIKLKDYAKQIQSNIGMTIDDMIIGLEHDKVVFYNISASKGVWDKVAPNNGLTGWLYNISGNVSDSAQVASVRLDKEKKTLVIEMPENSEAGVSLTVNIGFAVNNDRDYDKYIRFIMDIAVSDPGTILRDVSIPQGDYNAYELNFSSIKNVVESCFGITVIEFNKALQDVDGDIAMYVVSDDGVWDKTSNYTANGIGYWCTASGGVTKYGDNCAFYLETHDGAVGIGRYVKQESGTKFKAHFVYVSKSDPSKFMEFVLNVTLE